ncbi:hypothetical protein ACUY1T_05900 [Billgrantia sp. Q4P2]|uniref:hypothetical protein n=1 Tax=Billgrantia sp. Q4P2 TaxID=3463857 RepID=UPI004056A0E5
MSRYLMAALMRGKPSLARRLAFARARWSAWCQARLATSADQEAGIDCLAPLRVMGLEFPNPLGIAAGFDRWGQLGRKAGALGFGCIEIGTLTPQDMAVLVNSEPTRDGSGTMLGVNIGMNPGTGASQALQDYLACLGAVWNRADYITVNLCSPQAGALLHPNFKAGLDELLAALKQEQRVLTVVSGRYVPLAVKIRLTPGSSELPEIVSRLAALRFDAVVAAIDEGPPATPRRYAMWQTPLWQRQACEQVGRLATLLSGGMPIIAVGGVGSAGHVAGRLCAGAALVQMHDALVYQGPGVAHAIRREMVRTLRSAGCEASGPRHSSSTRLA